MEKRLTPKNKQRLLDAQKQRYALRLKMAHLQIELDELPRFSGKQWKTHPDVPKYKELKRQMGVLLDQFSAVHVLMRKIVSPLQAECRSEESAARKHASAMEYIPAPMGRSTFSKRPISLRIVDDNDEPIF